MSQAKHAEGDPIVIKKYANRRLYNTRSSSYITLDHLAAMTREDVEFRVVDAKTGADITHSILTQIIMDEEAGGEKMLPTSFLRELIGMYGNSMQGLLPGYLEASMQHFRENQVKLRKAIEESIGANPLAQLAQRNMEVFRAAATSMVPAARKGDGKSGAERDEIAALRAEMAEMQKKLDALSK